MEELVLSTENQEVLSEFLSRPRKLKYDSYNNKLYHIIWSESAIEQLNNKKREQQKEKYVKTYQKKEKQTQSISLYLRHKMGLPILNRGRPKCIKNEGSEFNKAE